MSKNTRTERVAKAGSWRLVVADNRDADLDAQINDLFGQVSSDLNTWRELGAKYSIDVFCGVFMETGNDGLVLDPATLCLLAERGARLDLTIYCPHES